MNGGIRLGPEVALNDLQMAADVGFTRVTEDVVAIRGDRLALTRACYTRDDQRKDGFYAEVLHILESDGEKRIAATIVFDPDDIDAAFEELDARYLAGEAAQYAQTWSAVMGTFAAANRRELAEFTPDWVTIDHRRAVAFAPGELASYAYAALDDMAQAEVYVEAVHRLNSLGAIVTYVAHGTSTGGFAGEWRGVSLSTVEGERVNRSELFDEADLDAALACLEELSEPVRRLENAASRVAERFCECFGARDWVGMGDTLADDVCTHDNRPVVGVGERQGRDLNVADWQAVAEVGTKNLASAVIATRGERLVLSRFITSGRDQRPEAFRTEVLCVIETNGDNCIVECVMFEAEKIDAAFEELDARYLAGEAAACARTWSVVTEMHAALNRHEAPLQAPNCVRIDHRRLATFEMGDLAAFCSATWDLTPEAMVYVEAVHRLTDLGAVFTQVTQGSSPEGFDVEWRMVDVLTVDGDLTNHGEIFDESDLDAALARFDELNASRPRLENTATRGNAQVADAFNRRDLERYLTTFDANARWEDRRKGLRSDVPMESKLARSVFFGAPASWRMEIKPLAIRGSRLALSRYLIRDDAELDRPITVEVLLVTEVNDDGLFCHSVTFDPNDVDAAFAELDARYLAGEAAAHARAWSLVLRTYTAFNRHELSPRTPNWVNIDHRRAMGSPPGDMAAYVREMWTVAPDVATHIDAVYRLSDAGAVFSHVESGTSQRRFAAEWREITLLTFEGDAINRCEIFDEVDLDSALTTFDELNQPTARLENDATQTWARLVDAYNCRNLDAFVALIAPDGQYHDRRKGLRDTRDGSMRWRVAQTLFDFPPSFRLETQPLAIRGLQLCLLRQALRDTDDAERSIVIELLTVLEATEEGLAHTIVNFDTDDIDSAMAELTARWIASGEVTHPEVIEVARINAEAANRHEWDALVNRHAGATYVNHRQLASGADTVADDMSSLRVLASMVPDLSFEAAEILTHSASGFVTHTVAKGTSTDGVAIEIPLLVLMLVEGDRITHAETFDLDQRDLALTRFEELNASG